MGFGDCGAFELASRGAEFDDDVAFAFVWVADDAGPVFGGFTCNMCMEGFLVLVVVVVLVVVGIVIGCGVWRLAASGGAFCRQFSLLTRLRARYFA